MGLPSDSERTRARITAAAGELFADHGYHGVTVRDIIQKAKTHQSALNYHFAGKESLYREVLRHACDSPEVDKLGSDALLEMPAREALQQVIAAWIREYTFDDASQWKAKLLDRECLQPSGVFQELVAAHVLPQLKLVAAILARVVGRPAESTEMYAAVLGLLGQVNMLTLYRQLLDTVIHGLYQDIHHGDWLARALAESTIAFASAANGGSGP
jgi:TetR/AcrR family transcriptional regulator, regulator of cefoperazone and chloramphenicol sensitivity